MVEMVPTLISLSSPLPDPLATVPMLVATVYVEGVVLCGIPILVFLVNPLHDTVVTVLPLFVTVRVDVVWGRDPTLSCLPDTIPDLVVAVSP